MTSVSPNSLRIGCVKYLNARPLIHGWSGDVVFDHPTRLCEQLAQGKLDVALVSSFEFLRNPIYEQVDDICISSSGPVYSVFLAHTGELTEIEEIEIDPASQTSVNLLRCLLTEAGLTPRLITGTLSDDPVMTPFRARFFIGDQGIRFRNRSATTVRFWDLGEEWQKLVRLPFVYALWLIRPEAALPRSIGDRLRFCRDNNLRQLDSVIATEKEFSPEFCRYYFQQCLGYRFGSQEKEGLATFQRLCEKHGILQAVPS